MRTENIAVEAFTIYDAMRAPGRGAIDPITVTLRDVGAGGQIIVECYGAAWSQWFGAIGRSTLRQFIAETSAGYLADKLTSSTVRRCTKREEAYVIDICRAIIDVLKVAP